MEGAWRSNQKMMPPGYLSCGSIWTRCFNYIFTLREQCGGRHEFSPLMDIYESAGSYVIEMDLPGFSENDFTVTVIGSALRIEGVKRQDKNDSGNELHLPGKTFRPVQQNYRDTAGI